jgi:hypothetical protein
LPGVGQHFATSKPVNWTDPDTLIVGWGGPHPTSLTPDEQYTRIGLWCMLAPIFRQPKAPK